MRTLQLLLVVFGLGSTSCGNAYLCRTGAQDRGCGELIGTPREQFQEALTRCHWGDAWACHQVGDRYVSGERGNVGRAGTDLDMASHFYARACDGNHPEGCMALATLLESGQLEGEHAELAASLYEEADEIAERNYRRAEWEARRQQQRTALIVGTLAQLQRGISTIGQSTDQQRAEIQRRQQEDLDRIRRAQEDSQARAQARESAQREERGRQRDAEPSNAEAPEEPTGEAGPVAGASQDPCQGTALRVLDDYITQFRQIVPHVGAHMRARASTLAACVGGSGGGGGGGQPTGATAAPATDDQGPIYTDSCAEAARAANASVANLPRYAGTISSDGEMHEWALLTSWSRNISSALSAVHSVSIPPLRSPPEHRRLMRLYGGDRYDRAAREEEARLLGGEQGRAEAFLRQALAFQSAVQQVCSSR